VAAVATSLEGPVKVVAVVAVAAKIVHQLRCLK
jgi:hypothetical protein